MAKTKKLSTKSVTKAYMDFRVKAHTFINSVLNPSRRKLLTVEAANAQGQLNGMTVVELITIAQLSDGTQERVYIEAYDKTLSIYAEKRNPTSPPYELRS